MLNPLVKVKLVEKVGVDLLQLDVAPLATAPQTGRLNYS